MGDDRSLLFCSQEITVVTQKNQQNLSYMRDHVQISDKESCRLLLVLLLILLLVLLLVLIVLLVPLVLLLILLLLLLILILLLLLLLLHTTTNLFC